MASMEGWSVALPASDERAPAADLASLVTLYARLLFRVAHSILRSPTEAEEVVQDVFVRVLQHRGALADIRESIRELKYYRSTAFVTPPGPSTSDIAAIAAELGPHTEDDESIDSAAEHPTG